MFYGATPIIFERARELRISMTEPEKKLWQYLRTNPMGYRFRRQHPLLSYIADFFCYKLNLVIEIDGTIHNRKDKKAKDIEKEIALSIKGIRTIRFTNFEVINQFEKVIDKIQTILRERKSGTPPLGGSIGKYQV
jgi:imidazole glycerol-phosphate synthase subunit HisF